MYLVTRGSSTSSSNSARLRSCLAAALSCSEANELPHKVHSVSAVWTSTVESTVTTAVPVRTLGGRGMYRLLGWLPCLRGERPSFEEHRLPSPATELKGEREDREGRRGRSSHHFPRSTSRSEARSA